MLDAVDSGGYGVLGLYAAQSPVAVDPPRPADLVRSTPRETGAPGLPQAPAAQSLAAPQTVGSAPVAPSGSGESGQETAGQNYAGQGEAQARQTSVAVSLYAATAAAETPSASSEGSGKSAVPDRVLRAYGRSGQSLAASRPGTALSVRA